MLQVREAARRSVLTEAGISDQGKGMEFLRLKGFENAVIQAATRALEEWREEAHQGGCRVRPLPAVLPVLPALLR